MLKLRRAYSEDAGQLVDIVERAFAPQFGEAWNGAQLVAALEAKDGFGEIGQRGGEVVAFSLARQVLDEAELLLVAVRPDLRREGIGRALLTNVMDRVRARGGRTLFLEVREGNAAAVALYNSMGFAEVGRRRGYYAGANQVRYDAITMRRDI